MTFGGGLVDTMPQAVVEVIPNDFKVRVEVRRTNNDLWFARFFGKDVMAVSARAAAIASPAGAARCVKPFAIPDIWHDQNGDLDGDHVWDMPVQQGNKEVGGEVWRFGDDPGDYYSRYDPGVLSPVPPRTGYGSTYRTDVHPGLGPRDQAGRSPIRTTSPRPSRGSSSPGSCRTGRVTQTCSIEPGAGENGAKSYMANICNCNSSPIQLNTDYQIKTGNMVGPTAKGVGELIGQDKDAYWDAGYTNTQTGQRGRIAYKGPSDYSANPMAGPRVIKVAMYDPGEMTKSGVRGPSSSTTSGCSSSRTRGSKDP